MEDTFELPHQGNETWPATAPAQAGEADAPREAAAGNWESYPLEILNLILDP